MDWSTAMVKSQDNLQESVIAADAVVVTEDDYQYKICTETELDYQMQTLITECEQLLNLPKPIIRLLLGSLKWNFDFLIETYFENDNPHVICEKFAIPLQNQRQTYNSSFDIPRTSSSGSSNVCSICCISTIDIDDIILLNCDHWFCKSCCQRYIQYKIETNSIGVGVTCPSPHCPYLIDDEKINEILVSKLLLKQYERKILQNFIQSNKLLRQCPTNDCNYVIKVDYVEARPLKCKCETIFCCKCTQNWHESISCELLKKWIKKCNDDSETTNWLTENTKECPNCGIIIMKDGGCNHIICKNSSCKFHFCWTCLGSWDLHGSSWYNCNRFNEEESKLARSKQTEYRQSLNRFMFYSSRFKTHKLSFALEKRLFEQIDTVLIKTQQFNWNEIEFLQLAIRTLLSCRRTLMYTYAFAYYLQKNNQVAIFEHNQRDLEIATEMLSEYLERDLDSELESHLEVDSDVRLEFNSIENRFSKTRQLVQDKYRYCAQRRLILLEHVREGYENQWWYFEFDC